MDTLKFLLYANILQELHNEGQTGNGCKEDTVSRARNGNTASPGFILVSLLRPAGKALSIQTYKAEIIDQDEDSYLLGCKRLDHTGLTICSKKTVDAKVVETEGEYVAYSTSEASRNRSFQLFFSEQAQSIEKEIAQREQMIHSYITEISLLEKKIMEQEIYSRKLCRLKDKSAYAAAILGGKND